MMPSKDNFLQSEEWKRVQEAAGKTAVRMVVDGKENFGYVEALPLVGSYLYFPRGPESPAETLHAALVEQAKKIGAAWIRIEPFDDVTLSGWQNVFGDSLVKAPNDTQPRETFVVDITKDEVTLLSEMKSKTRYNIRLAEKHGVRVFATREKKYQEALFSLLEETARRKGIKPHPRQHYERLFTVLPENMCQLFVAEYAGEIVAADIVIFFGETATYLHGGSSDRHREKMAPYFLHWEEMKFAKKRNFCFYDFGGIKTASEKNNWAGITNFKTGFSPKTTPTVFLGCYDIVLDGKRYALYNHLRRLKQGLRNIQNIFRTR